MKLTTINQIVEGILDEDDMSRRRVVANEAVIYWKTFYIAENEGLDKAMEYLKGSHSEDEYQEFRTFAVAESK